MENASIALVTLVVPLRVAGIELEEAWRVKSVRCTM